MSAWRRKALELFPDERREIQDGRTTIYQLFFLLLPRCRQAHKDDDIKELGKIYGYAEWCFRQRAQSLWNSAGVAFYEHLGDEPETRDEMHLWVKPDIFDDVLSLLQRRMRQDDLTLVQRRFNEIKRSTPTSHL